MRGGHNFQRSLVLIFEDAARYGTPVEKAFDDLMMLSTELERYRYNYNMTKSNLERAIYWMNRNYRDNMPELTKIQRKIAFLMDRKSDLFKELFNVEQKILKEKAAQKTLKLKYYNKVASMRLSVKLGNARILSKHNTVFESKRMEILDLLQAIVNGDHYIHEVLLDKPWSGTLDLSFLEKESNEQKMISNYETQLSAVMLTRKLISALNEDEFARAYRVFICNGDFVSVLNHVAEELGYMLDFQWVDYVKKTLEIEQEVRWLELFKVFKINFVEDIQDLKDHMKHFSKRHGDSVVFDLNGVLDGFLHFVWLKRQSINSQDLSLDEKEATYEVHEEFWKTVDKIIPKSLLWESVFELLETYRQFIFWLNGI
ncbi:uncharacterized protein CDAR_413601 [Caerostris darwini]|uniref:Uncharacterized protein n=1 Tax=Caerostris darwini TaxID=1538125 RepID=A0AAV4T776_9ARAC|nr:uncharacterized protein CDAR_413601 [Caerostris darwini]